MKLVMSCVRCLPGPAPQARSADEQTLHDSLYLGSQPHTPLGGSQHGGLTVNVAPGGPTGQAPHPLFGSFNPDSPRPPSMDAVGRSTSSNSLGGNSFKVGALGGDWGGDWGGDGGGGGGWLARGGVHAIVLRAGGYGGRVVTA